jgi:hypothetical protein
MAVDFLVFSEAHGADAFASKGVLGVKVQLSSDKRMVGYIFNTHVQVLHPNCLKETISSSFGL